MPSRHVPKTVRCEGCGAGCYGSRTAFPLCRLCRKDVGRLSVVAVSKRDENDSLAPPERIAELAGRADAGLPLFPVRRARP